MNLGILFYRDGTIALEPFRADLVGALGGAKG